MIKGESMHSTWLFQFICKGNLAKLFLLLSVFGLRANLESSFSLGFSLLWIRLPSFAPLLLFNRANLFRFLPGSDASVNDLHKFWVCIISSSHLGYLCVQHHTHGLTCTELLVSLLKKARCSAVHSTTPVHKWALGFTHHSLPWRSCARVMYKIKVP